MNPPPPASEFMRFRLRPWGMISAAGALAGLAGLLGFLGPLHWLFDLCSHFRVQYALGLALVSALLLIPGQRRAAALYGVLAGLNAAVILPHFFGKADVPAAGRPVIRAMLANVNTQTGDPAAVAAEIQRLNPDVLVLEEINEAWLDKLRPVLERFPHAEHEARVDNFGIGLWSKFPFTDVSVPCIGEAGVPSILAEIESPGGRFTVLATHPLPPAGREYTDYRNDQLAELPEWVRQAKSPLVLVGDLNTTPWNHTFKRLLRDTGLKDSARGRGLQSTWPTALPPLLIPLDHCLYSDDIGVVDRQTGAMVGSDHYPILVEFVVLGQRPPRHYPRNRGGDFGSPLP